VFVVGCLLVVIVGLKVRLDLRIVGFRLNVRINFRPILENRNNLPSNDGGLLDQVINVLDLEVIQIGVNHKTPNKVVV
jgi:hypothetical protein